MATRRRFIRDCSALAASAAFLPTLATGAPRALREVSVSIGTVPYADFAGLLGSVFAARGPLGWQALELAGVERSMDGTAAVAAATTTSASGSGAVVWEAFSLIFRGDPATPLGQDTYAFEQARLGRFEMFIVPVDRADADGCWYEAVFHRPAPEVVIGRPNRPNRTAPALGLRRRSARP